MNITNQNLTELGKLLDPTGIIKSTKEELLAAFKKIVEMVQKMKTENSQEMMMMKQMCEKMISKMESESSSMMGKTDKYMMSEMESLLRRFSAEQKKIDDKLATIENGRDADETKIVSDVISQLPTLQKIVDETIRQIPKQEEKIFGIDDIEGLKKTFEEMEERIGKSRRFGGGGFSKIALEGHLISNEVVAGSGTIFTLAHIPNPSTSLKLYGSGQRLTLGATNDYTISGLTITTINSYSAGQILADYNI